MHLWHFEANVVYAICLHVLFFKLSSTCEMSNVNIYEEGLVCVQVV